MKRVLKILGILVATVVLVVIVIATIFYIRRSNEVNEARALLGDEAAVLSYDGRELRDLNKNGRLDVYEDPDAPLDDRIEDLLSQMTVEEKAGTMFITMIGFEDNGDPIDKPLLSTELFDVAFSLVIPSSSEMVASRLMNSFNTVHAYDADVMARFNNNIQKMAERTRLGIPVTIATDPRHGTQYNPGAAIYTPAFSAWPSPLGMAATRDTALVREFGEIANQEYRSVGIRLALHPMADLATEPRWARNNGTFGEDAVLATYMTKSYVLGFQGDSLSNNSVACMSKHFSGGGPQKDGEDAHFPYGKEQVYPGGMFEYHAVPFKHGALPAGTAQIMPYYGIPVGQTSEDVAFGFNKEIITDLLRDSLGFDGVVCTDWNILTDTRFGEGRAWGVEELTPIERMKKSLDAGCDQFGGESATDLLIELVNSGEIGEERLDVSVGRILRDKFILGLFDDPYVDEQAALGIAGREDFRERGKDAQAASTVLLKNEGLLPLSSGVKLFVDGFKDLSAFDGLAELVDDPEDADVVVTRAMTPYDPRDDSFLESFFHQGRLYYTDEELADLRSWSELKPVVTIVNLERPAILTPVEEASSGLFAEFGTSDEVMVDILFDRRQAEGLLPFELPSSWEAVLDQKEDVPYDSKDPLYRFAFGIDWTGRQIIKMPKEEPRD